MRLLRVGRREQGSAVVEFAVLEVLLLIPLVYLILTLARVQAGAFAVTAATREAGRAFITADSAASAPARAEAAARIAFEDHGFSPADVDLHLRCDATPCLRPHGRVEATAQVRVALPLIPAFARRVVPLEVTLRADHVAVVDRFRDLP